ncbi:hypothetical protein [Ohtaekwangia sp.]|uniref:hypothetical protein n=1 Tax=Ohtaekwangia sp. TaxID=2066019 RepID=UPI002F94E88C
MNIPGHDAFRRRAALAAAGVLAIHVLLCIYFMVTPARYPFHKTKIGAVYKRVFLIGPFFKEERISVSADLYIRHKMGSTWSPYSNYGKNFLDRYYASSWRYEPLQRNILLRNFARAAYMASVKKKRQPLGSSPSFCRLNQFILKELIQSDSVDSVQLVYIFHSFAKEQHTFRTDTTWNITYNPRQICAH